MSDLASRFKQANPAVLWLMTGMLFVLFPHFYYQPVYLLSFIIALLTWRFIIELRIVRLPPSWVSTALAVITFSVVTYGFHTVFGRDAGVALLITMMCLKLMEIETQRDFSFAVFLGYFVVVTGFLFNQSILVGIDMMTAIFLLTTSLVSYNRISKGSNHQFSNAKQGINLILQATPLTLLLFLLFPRITGPLWGLPEQGASGSTGLSSSMSPGQITELAFDNSVAFRVKFTDRVPAPEKLYWRGPVFTYFDGYTWQELAGNSRKFFGPKWVPELPPVPLVKTAEAIKYTVMLEPNNENWLLALDIPTIYPPDSYLTKNYELVTDERISKLKQYSLSSHVNYKLSPDQKPANRVYLQIPQFVGPKARNLVAKMREEVDPLLPYDKQMVDNFLNYFRVNPFYYTRTPPPMLDNPVDQFLFDARRGFCEHYASAFAVLMRASGIPARIVTGYYGGELNTMGDYYIVRQSDAHAWTEVWLTGQGWVRIDPTAVIPPQRIEQQEIRNRLQRSTREGISSENWITYAFRHVNFLWDDINRNWNDWIVGFTPKKQQSLLDKIGIKHSTRHILVVILFVGLGLFIALVGFYLSLHRIRKPNKAQQLFSRYCRKLARKGFLYLPTETANHFAHRVLEQREDLKNQVSEITQLYNEIRYAEVSPDIALEKLEQCVSHFRP